MIRLLLLAFSFFLSINLAAIGGCGDKVILGDAVPKVDVIKFLIDNANDLKDVMSESVYQRLITYLREGKVEYYGGGRFVFKESGTNALIVDEKYFKALGEVIVKSKPATAAKVKVASGANGAAAGTNTTTTTSTTTTTASTASTTSTGASTSAGTAGSTNAGGAGAGAAKSSSLNLAASTSGKAPITNLPKWAKQQKVVAQREVNAQLNEKFGQMANHYQKSPPGLRNIIRSPTLRNAYQVPVDSDVGKILNTLVNKRSKGSFTILFDKNGTVLVMNAAGQRRFSPDVFETFLHKAVDLIKQAQKTR